MFQLSLIALARWDEQVRALLWTINFYHSFLSGLISGQFVSHDIDFDCVCVIVSFFKESFFSFCPVAWWIILKNYSIIPKYPVNSWDKKSGQNLNINLCIYWKCKECHFPVPLTHMQPHIINNWKFACFLRAAIFLDLFGTSPNKSFSSITSADSQFITEYDFHPVIDNPQFLFLMQLNFIYKTLSIQPQLTQNAVHNYIRT